MLKLSEEGAEQVLAVLKNELPDFLTQTLIQKSTKRKYSENFNELTKSEKELLAAKAHQRILKRRKATLAKQKDAGVTPAKGEVGDASDEEDEQLISEALDDSSDSLSVQQPSAPPTSPVAATSETPLAATASVTAEISTRTAAPK